MGSSRFSRVCHKRSQASGSKFNVVVVTFPPFYYFVWEMLGEDWDTPPEQNVQGMNSGVVTR